MCNDASVLRTTVRLCSLMSIFIVHSFIRPSVGTMCATSREKDKEIFHVFEASKAVTLENYNHLFSLSLSPTICILQVLLMQPAYVFVYPRDD